MREAVQYLFSLAESLYCQPVVFLVQEETGFLAVFHIDQIADAVFLNLDFRIKRIADKSLLPFHPFLFSYFGVAALIDAPDDDAVFRQDTFQDVQDLELHAVDAKGQGFYHQHIRKLVHHQSGQEVCLSEYDTAAGSIAYGFSVFPGVPYPPLQKSLVDDLVFSAGHHPYTDPGVHIEKAVSHKIAVEIMDRHQISVLKIAQDTGDLIVIDPHAAGFDCAAFSFFQGYDCMIHRFYPPK